MIDVVGGPDGRVVKMGDHRAAALLHGALNASGAMASLPFEPHDANDASAAVDQLRAALGDDGFATAMSAGASMSEADLVRLVQTRIAAHNR